MTPCASIKARADGTTLNMEFFGGPHLPEPAPCAPMKGPRSTSCTNTGVFRNQIVRRSPEAPYHPYAPYASRGYGSHRCAGRGERKFAAFLIRQKSQILVANYTPDMSPRIVGQASFAVGLPQAAS
jgi:hypothetical protein